MVHVALKRKEEEMTNKLASRRRGREAHIMHVHMLHKKQQTYFVCPIYIITISEHRTKIALGFLSGIVMIVMELCATEKWDEPCEAKWEVVTTFRVSNKFIGDTKL